MIPKNSNRIGDRRSACRSQYRTVGESVWWMDSKITTMHWWRRRISLMTSNGQLRSNRYKIFLSSAATSCTPSMRLRKCKELEKSIEWDLVYSLPMDQFARWNPIKAWILENNAETISEKMSDCRAEINYTIFPLDNYIHAIDTVTVARNIHFGPILSSAKDQLACSERFSASHDECTSILQISSRRQLLSDWCSFSYIEYSVKKSHDSHFSRAIRITTAQPQGEINWGTAMITWNIRDMAECEWKSSLSFCNIPSPQSCLVQPSQKPRSSFAAKFVNASQITGKHEPSI